MVVLDHIRQNLDMHFAHVASAVFPWERSFRSHSFYRCLFFYSIFLALYRLMRLYRQMSCTVCKLYTKHTPHIGFARCSQARLAAGEISAIYVIQNCRFLPVCVVLCVCVSCMHMKELPNIHFIYFIYTENYLPGAARWMTRRIRCAVGCVP